MSLSKKNKNFDLICSPPPCSMFFMGVMSCPQHFGILPPLNRNRLLYVSGQRVTNAPSWPGCAAWIEFNQMFVFGYQKWHNYHRYQNTMRMSEQGLQADFSCSLRYSFLMESACRCRGGDANVSATKKKKSWLNFCCDGFACKCTFLLDYFVKMKAIFPLWSRHRLEQR